MLESPFSSEVISSIEFTLYFLQKHLGHYENNRSFTGFNDLNLNDLPIIPINQENLCQQWSFFSLVERKKITFFSYKTFWQDKSII